MAVPFTTYPTDIPVGYAGMPARQEASNRISRTIEDVAGIGFGKAAFRGVGDAGITGTPATGKFLGITIAHYAPPPARATGVQTDAYPEKSSVPLMTRGVIWVVAAVAVNDGDQVYVLPNGGFTNVSNAGANVIADGWFFDTTAALGALARIARR